MLCMVRAFRVVVGQPIVLKTSHPLKLNRWVCLLDNNFMAFAICFSLDWWGKERLGDARPVHPF